MKPGVQSVALLSPFATFLDVHIISVSSQSLTGRFNYDIFY